MDLFLLTLLNKQAFGSLYFTVHHYLVKAKFNTRQIDYKVMVALYTCGKKKVISDLKNIWKVAG